jgi:hypothetical protein
VTLSDSVSRAAAPKRFHCRRSAVICSNTGRIHAAAKGSWTCRRTERQSKRPRLVAELVLRSRHPCGCFFANFSSSLNHSP